VTRTTIVIPQPIDERLEAHLGKRGEQLAFLGARASGNSLEVLETLLVGSELLDPTERWHVALSDSGRVAVLAWASQGGFTLIEVHTHGRWFPACFSQTDLRGLADWVPHVMWRLGGRPYAALVVAGDTLDALVWDSKDAAPATAAVVERSGQALIPTGNSLRALLDAAGP
jgi:hypothetical protein